MDSKGDPARKHGKQDPTNKINFTCNYCGKVTKGGVYRFKQHLVGGFSCVTKCEQCPEHVREEIQNFMMKKASVVENRDPLVHVIDDPEEEGNPIPTQKKLKVGSKFVSKANKGPMDVYLAQNAQDVVRSRKNVKQTTINEACKKELRERTCRDIARFFYEGGVPFHLATLECFKVMVESIGQYGRGFKPPSMYELRVPLLRKEVDDTLLLIEEHKKEWAETGCSILSDGWRDSIAQKDIINFLVNSPKGSVFIRSIDVSNVVKDADMLFLLLSKMVEEIGEQNVVQVVTDNASNYVKAGKMLQSKFPRLYWTPCAAHCIDLMLEDVGTKIPRVKIALKKAISICGYIYNNHIGVVNMMRTFTNGQNLHRPSITRFATSFITLKQIHKLRTNLRQMMTSEEWTNSKWSKETGGKKILKYLLQESFWRNVVYALKLTCPLVKVLRIVDGDKKPPMGYIYEAIDRAKETIAKSFDNKEEEYKDVFELIDKRWECQLHRPLHAAGHYFNPSIFYDNPNILRCEEIVQGMYQCMSKLVPDEEIQDKISLELSSYKKATGLFGLPVAIRQRKLKSPADWWNAYGASAPNLQNFAVRVLSLTCSATGCERNWSVFEHLHTKKRNRLAQERLNDMVFVKANRQLVRRHSSDTSDPIILDEIDESNEWLIGKMEGDGPDEEDDFVFDDDDLTWGAVSRATGAEEPSYSTRMIARTRNDEPGQDKGKALVSTSTSKSHFMMSLNDEEEEDFEENSAREEEDDDEDIYSWE